MQFVSSIEAAVAGVIRLVRMHGYVVKKLFADLSVFLVVVGVAVGVFYWYGMSALGETDDPTSAIGLAMTWSGIICVFWMASQVLFRVGSAVRGHDRPWTGPAVATVAALTLALSL